MGRKGFSLRELRAQVEAAEARGLMPTEEPKKPSRKSSEEARAQPEGRMRVVWAVCDMGNRTIATFSYREKAEAEAYAQALKAKGKGDHFVRSIKEPMESGR